MLSVKCFDKEGRELRRRWAQFFADLVTPILGYLQPQGIALYSLFIL